MDGFKSGQHLPTNMASTKAHLIFAHWDDDLNLSDFAQCLFFGHHDVFLRGAWDSWLTDPEHNPAFARKLVPNDFSGADPIIAESGGVPFSSNAPQGSDVLSQFTPGVDRAEPHELQFASGNGFTTALVSSTVVQTDLDLHGLRDFQIVIAGASAASADFVF